MNAATLFRASAARLNRAVMLPLLRTDPGRRALGGAFAVVRYTGRRSGRPITLVTNYRRLGDHVVMRVAAPQAKTWWRNFTGAGAPVELGLGRTRLTGHAVAVQDERGRVTVTVTPG